MGGPEAHLGVPEAAGAAGVGLAVAWGTLGSLGQARKLHCSGSGKVCRLCRPPLRMSCTLYSSDCLPHLHDRRGIHVVSLATYQRASFNRELDSLLSTTKRAIAIMNVMGHHPVAEDDALHV